MDIKKSTLLLAMHCLTIIASAVWVGCAKNNHGKIGGSDVANNAFTDSRDSQTYRTTTIGDLSWMAENLGYAAEGSSGCADADCAAYGGRYYTWDAAMSACPAGWRLPTLEDFAYLVEFAGGPYRAGEKLKSQTGWKEGLVNKLSRKDTDEYGRGGNGTDEYGFKALPVGYLGEGGVYDGGDSSYAYWWSAKDYGGYGDALIVCMQFYLGDVSTLYNAKKGIGFPVRCVRGEIGRPFTVSFNANGGVPKSIPSIVVDSVATFRSPISTFPANPTMAGHAFAGWFDGERRYDGETPVFKSMTLRAAWKKLDGREDGDTLIDTRDGQKYRTVIIGGRRWMAENLNYETGDSSWCYDNDAANCATYGRLYTGDTAMVACPAGWHLPKNDEWLDLIEAAGGEEVGGTVLKSKAGWNRCYSDGSECVDNGNGTDDFGFEALPGGCRLEYEGLFGHIGEMGYWWTASEIGPWTLLLGEGLENLFPYGPDYNMHSVRCVRDEGMGPTLNLKPTQNFDSAIHGRQDAAPTNVINTLSGGGNSGSFTDIRDGQKYRTVKIGTQVWMAENLNYKTGKSRCYGNDDSNCIKYGRLYDFETAAKACPSGWHLPDTTEWNALMVAANGIRSFGEDIRSFYYLDAGKSLKSKTGWSEPYEGEDINGTDEFGFSAMPGGEYGGSVGSFGDVGGHGYWWSATGKLGGAYYRNIYDFDHVFEFWANNWQGFSVRCVKD